MIEDLVKILTFDYEELLPTPLGGILKESGPSNANAAAGSLSRIVLWRRAGNWGVGIRRVEMSELRIYHGSTDSEKQACSISACGSTKCSRETNSMDSYHR